MTMRCRVGSRAVVVSSDGSGVRWKSERERFAAIAAGLRVVSTGGDRPQVQIQILELGDGGLVRVASVVPGDSRHMALYRTLVKPESEWGKADNGSN